MRHYLGCLGLVLGLWVGLVLVVADPVEAGVQLYQEQPGQLTVRSQHSLQDNAQHSWQTVVFKRFQADHLEGIFLRLVGFPGQVQVAVDQPLQILVADQWSWQAPVALDSATLQLPHNVGQYDLQPLLEHIDPNLEMELAIPLDQGLTASLQIPASVRHEWQQVTDFSALGQFLGAR